MKTLTLKNIVLASTLAVICGSANAATAVSDIKTATADITFGSTSSITHTLTPVKDLVAGKVADKTTVANGSVTGTDLENNNVSLRFTPNTAEDIEPVLGNVATIVGKNTNNKLTLSIQPVVGTSFTGAVIDGATWLALLKGQNGYKLQTNGEQTVAADIYTASIDALEITQ
ncbi:hypothetical protein ACBQ20_06900 [Proteus vulgaris]|uniref:hypothetical protein n=1 Tax=Proteus TaxID=583 RepID=UPI0032DB3BB8